MEGRYEEYWRKAALRTSRRVNFAWWLQKFAPLFLLTSLLSACLLIVSRRQDLTSIPSLPFAIFSLALLASWLLAKKHFTNPEASLVRLESQMGLKNALTAANDGISRWPSPPEKTDDGFRWNWRMISLPFAAGIAFLVAGYSLPISPVDLEHRQLQQPRAWQELEADIEQLTEEEIIEEDYLEKMEERLEELKAQDQDDWFSHASLEATDSLKSSHETEVARLQRNLLKALQNFEELQQTKLSPADRDQLMEDLDKNLRNMEAGAMKPNLDLLKRLGENGLKELKNLTPEQQQELRQQLKKNAEKLAQTRAGQKKGDWLDQLMAQEEKKGEGENNGPGDPNKKQPGKGGVDRGPGVAPQVLGDESEAFRLSRIENLESQDLSNSLPGDLLQLQDGEHEVDRSGSRPQSGGGIKSAGTGGDRIWKESLMPDEKKVIRNFFK